MQSCLRIIYSTMHQLHMHQRPRTSKKSNRNDNSTLQLSLSATEYNQGIINLNRDHPTLCRLHHYVTEVLTHQLPVLYTTQSWATFNRTNIQYTFVFVNPLLFFWDNHLHLLTEQTLRFNPRLKEKFSEGLLCLWLRNGFNQCLWKLSLLRY